MNNKIIGNKVKRINKNIIEFFDNSAATSKIVEVVAFLLYIVLLVVIECFHEPWTDELQSYMIARDATYSEMIFRLGHGEGHPALWWIVLSLFAKNGFSAELTLRIVSTIFNVLSAYLIIFKFKIPKVFRVCIPFTYFFFYQYGVISRCYCILILGFCLLTLVWNKKEKYPFKVICSMVLICFSCAYGIVLMFGLGLIWIVEILIDVYREKTLSIFINRKKEIISLIFLALVALLIVLQIWPSPNAFALNQKEMGLPGENIFFKSMYLLLLEPIDALFYTSVYSDTIINYYDIDMPVLIIGVMVSILYFSIVFMIKETYGRRRYFIIPQLLFSLVAANSFFYSHHTGITTVLFVFWICTCYENKDEFLIEKYNKTKYGHFLSEGEGKSINEFRYLLFMLPILVSIGWSISSGLLEIRAIYEPGKELIEKVNSYGERDYKISSYKLSVVCEYKSDNILTYNDYLNGRPICFTLQDTSDEEIDEKVKKWALIGYPDICTDFSSGLIESIELETGVNAPEYRWIDTLESGKIYKGVQEPGDCRIFMRSDLADELGGLGIEYFSTKK